MEHLFSIGELARCQHISKQTLIFYDKTGLFRPAWVDPSNGYRYYSAAQLDQLDTILILKKCGCSLKQIREMLSHYTTQSSLRALRAQLGQLDRQMEELRLVRSRLAQRCDQLEGALGHLEGPARPWVEDRPRQTLLLRPVEAPYTLREISLATKECFAQAFREGLPIYFQSGVIVPRERILAGRCTEARWAFLPTEAGTRARNLRQLPPGRCASVWHRGDYQSIGKSYAKLLSFCRGQGLRVVSDSWEFCVNDYITTGDESEYLTKIQFSVLPG